MAILPNYETWCRLIKIPKKIKTRPKMVERHIVTEILGATEYDSDVIFKIKQRSRNMAKSRKEVEKEITQRSLGELLGEEDVATFQRIEEI